MPRKKFLSFEEAKVLMHKLNLHSTKEWRNWFRKNPNIGIPSTPEVTYKNSGWKSWGDFLNSGNYKNDDLLSFSDARKFAHKLKFKKQKEWFDWTKSGLKPDNIPSTPQQVYKNRGWISWGDWLGTKSIATFNKSFLSYDEAIEYIHKLEIKSQPEWYQYAKSGEKPDNIPSVPDKTYKNNGWVSWAHWLGYIGNSKWTIEALLGYLDNIKNELIYFDQIELITVITANNLYNRLSKLGLLKKLQSTPANSKARKRVVDELITTVSTTTEETTDDTTFVTPDDLINETDDEIKEGTVEEVTETTSDDEVETPVNPIQQLHVFDLDSINSSLDDENIDFLIKNRLKIFWNDVLNNKVDPEALRKEKGKKNFTKIKRLFFNEYDAVVKIKSPNGYKFKHKPNLMQKLIAYRLEKERRYGNWSGTGAGKTLSAILAGRHVKAKNTVIVCNNSTVDGWVRSINEYFDNSNVYSKKKLDNVPTKLYNVIDKQKVRLNRRDNNYLILNYETFQLDDSENFVIELLDNNTIDYIILDEVQNVKQRKHDEESKRRNVLNKLLVHAGETNKDLYVLAMSATPIINNLTEPKKLIELVTGQEHDDLKVRNSIACGIEMYKALTRYGLRYKPNYDISENEALIPIDGSDLVHDIAAIRKGNVLEFEQLLVDRKLEAVKHLFKKGTLVYTHYVTDLIYKIGDYIKALGFTVGYYTGEDKTGLNNFRNGKVDILVGSAPVTTGIDGIQYVCDTLIPIVLPWTSSEYEQLKGRVNRQGTKFKKVNIYIPQVIIPLEDGRENPWCWDKRRYNIIKYKKTLADLAMDGNIPKDVLPSKEKLVESAQKEIIDWIKRLEKGDVIIIPRNKLKIPLNRTQLDKTAKKLGDFSTLNKTWSVTKSDNTHIRLSRDPSEWYYYHTLYSESRKTWPEIPYLEMAKKLEKRPDWVVGDFGCGENLMTKEIKNKVYAFDHIAIDDSVTACDIAKVPLQDASLDVAVFSLSLMGSNYLDYLKEAYRVLRPYGKIFVCEPANKWGGNGEELKEVLESVGFKCFGAVKNTDKFVYIDGDKN